MKINIKMNPTSKIIADKGLGGNGAVQMFQTQNILRRIEKYLPKRSGMLIKGMISATDISKPFIIIPGPYAKYLYYGKVMVGKAPKTVTDRDLQYDKSKNPQAGAYWDRALLAQEKQVMKRELQQFINRRAK